MFVCSLCAVIVPVILYVFRICKNFLREFVLFLGRHKKYSQGSQPLISPSSTVLIVAAVRMEYYARRWYPNSSNCESRDGFVPEPWEPRRRHQRYNFLDQGWESRRPAQWPDDGFLGQSLFDDFLPNLGSAHIPPLWHDGHYRDDHATHLPYRTRGDHFDTFGSRYRRSTSHSPRYSQHFNSAEQYNEDLFQSPFFENIDADNNRRDAKHDSSSTIYPDSIEEPDSDHAANLPNHERSGPSQKRPSSIPRSDLPPLSQRCETMHSGSRVASPSPSVSPSSPIPKSSHSSQQEIPFFSNFTFPPKSDSNASTPSRPGSSTSPVSPHSNEPYSQQRRHSGGTEHRRIRQAWLSIQRAKRRLKKEKREFRLREKIIDEREAELEMRARTMFEEKSDDGEDFRRWYDEADEGWWSIPGILDPEILD